MIARKRMCKENQVAIDLIHGIHDGFVQSYPGPCRMPSDFALAQGWEQGGLPAYKAKLHGISPSNCISTHSVGAWLRKSEKARPSLTG